MSNISDMLVNAIKLTSISVVGSTEYTSTTPFISLRNFSADEIMEAIVELSDKEKNHTHKVAYCTFTYPYGNVTRQCYVNDEEMCEMLAVLIMQKVIPAYANSKWFCNRNSDKTEEDKKSYVAKKTTELIEAFNRGLHTYNVSQIKTLDELVQNGKRSEETESK